MRVLPVLLLQVKTGFTASTEAADPVPFEATVQDRLRGAEYDAPHPVKHLQTSLSIQNEYIQLQC